MGFPPLITPASEPLDLAGVDACYSPRSVGEMVGHGRVRDAVTRGVLRPADMDKAEIGDVESIWVPVWRFEGTVDGFHISLGTHTRGGRERLMPRGGFKHRDRTLYVLARGGFMIDPAPKMKVARADLVALGADQDPFDCQGKVDADIDRASAQERAELALKREAQPSSALYANIEVKIHDARLVFYPLYVVRYRYAGEANEGGASMFFAALSGATGKVVAAHHPSAFKSIGGKLRRLFGA